MRRMLSGMQKSPFRYSRFEIFFKRIFRAFFPVPRSPWTHGHTRDICAIHLVPPERLIEFFSGCITLLGKYRDNGVGDYLEFGVFNGSSVGSIAIALRRQGTQSRLFGFDAFQGLPASSENEDGGVWQKGFYACSLGETKRCLQERGIEPQEVTFVEGWYDQTLTSATAQRYSIQDPGIVFIDCDTYSSSKLVLDFVGQHITKPCIICCDDWKLNDLDIKEMGEYRAFNEFLEENPRLSAREIPSYNRKSKAFLVTAQTSE